MRSSTRGRSAHEETSNEAAGKQPTSLLAVFGYEVLEDWEPRCARHVAEEWVEVGTIGFVLLVLPS